MVKAQFFTVTGNVVFVQFVTVRPFWARAGSQGRDIYPDTATRFDRENLDPFRLDVPGGPFVVVPHLQDGSVLDPIFMYVRDPAATVTLWKAVEDWERWVAAGQPAGW